MTASARISHGLWRDPSLLASLPDRCAALLSVAPDSAVVAGLAAARLHGLWLPTDQVSRIELILRRDPRRPSEQAHTRRSELRGRRRRLALDECVLASGLPVTSLARTWVDLAEQLPLPDLVAAGDSALRAGCSTTDLDVCLRRARGRRGVIRARAALDLLDRRSRSRPESHLRVGLVTSGLPAPAVNRAIHAANGEWLAEPDLHYKAARLALEYNGADHAAPKKMRKDITRELDVLTRGGWLMIVFGPTEVFHRIDQTAHTVRELLRERAPELLIQPRPLRRVAR